MTYKGQPLERVQYPTKRTHLFMQNSIKYLGILMKQSLNRGMRMCSKINCSTNLANLLIPTKNSHSLEARRKKMIS